MKKMIIISTILALALAFTSAFAGTAVLDGTLDAAAGYTLLADTTAAAATGFGTACDCSGIWWTHDASSAYFFIQGKVDTAASNGILVCIGNPTLSGPTAGSSLGTTANGGNAVYSSPGSGGNWGMDFVTQASFFGNPGGGSSNYYINDAIYLSNSVSSSGYIGDPGQTGSSVVSGGVTGAACSFNNGGSTGGLGSSQGFEFALPLSGSPFGDLGAGGGTVNVFAMIVSNTAYFSDDGIPVGTVGNFAGDPDFLTIAGGPWHTTISGVPVELSNFSAK